MPLPWFRVDTGIAGHDKILALLGNPNGSRASQANRYRAAFSYVCSIGWCVNAETDGRIPPAALPFIHGTDATAKLLVAAQLWEPVSGGWQVHNFEERQQTTAITEAKSEQARRAALVRWAKQKGEQP